MLNPKELTKKIIINSYDSISRLRFGKQKYIFLHSHMRARSTLLQSILCSSREITGDNEYHISYQDYSGLDLLRWKLLRMNTKWKPFPKYALDKINHSIHEINPSLFCDHNIFHIFLLRQPVDSIQSCVARWGHKRSLNYFLNYYNRRVKDLVSLSELASQSPNGYSYIESDTLIGKPKATLHQLTKYLNLCYPLSPMYKRETSLITNSAPNQENLLSNGKIVSKPRKHDNLISEEGFEELWLSYQAAHKELKDKSQL
ncbi:hypothetical protein PCC7418_2795 [Halothece sp. PCC 7418]|uniref:sulfotransferase family protein n=1 Tax=Halothece sp. (strain PCC 7418) TaxID=65093 RepID=UPI0002A06296|nr:sulfotransferase family protein [Halothece sp. PCC 7418]AFZ44928.1 hypothetical protein PCC7418_2795 [Halothece sp. PCC 7418]